MGGSTGSPGAFPCRLGGLKRWGRQARGGCALCDARAGPQGTPSSAARPALRRQCPSSDGAAGRGRLGLPGLCRARAMPWWSHLCCEWRVPPRRFAPGTWRAGRLVSVSTGQRRACGLPSLDARRQVLGGDQAMPGAVERPSRLEHKTLLPRILSCPRQGLPKPSVLGAFIQPGDLRTGPQCRRCPGPLGASCRKSAQPGRH